MATSNQALGNARRNKKDEFYTQLEDIEIELRHYLLHFKDKTVLCNCDDPFESNFFKYFALNFNRLGLKKLIATCYSGSSIIGTQFSLFEETPEERRTPYKAIITSIRDVTGDGGVDMLDIAELFKNGENKLERLDGNGDFKSDECLELLKQADIVVTNPPFSLFRDFVAKLVEYKKKFLIIGNVNAVTYKEIFPLIKNDQLWIGPSIHSGDRKFHVPDDYPLDASGCGIDPDGRKWVRVKGVRWFTNLDIKERHEELPLYKRYSAEEYPSFDNYKAIEVGKTSEIPCDYPGVMGVPITFLDKYCPDQFEIIGATESEGKGFSNGLWDSSSKIAQPLLNGKRVYKRVFIRNKKPETNF